MAVYFATHQSLGISCERKQNLTGSGGGNSRQRGAEGEKRAGGERRVDKKDIWFDDIPLECVDGDLVPKPKKSETGSLPLVTGSDTRCLSSCKTTYMYVAIPLNSLQCCLCLQGRSQMSHH